MPSPESATGGARWPRSASAIVGQTVARQHLLDIDGYSRIKEELPTGKSIKSRPFRARDGYWSLLYYPNGITSEYAEYMSIAFKLDGSVVPAAFVKAQAKISLLDPAGNLVPGYTKIIPAREYSSGGNGCGIGTFVKRDWLEKSEYLLDDCVKISCDVIIYNQHLGNLFLGKDGADVTFQVAGETFRAHKFLLVARSLVFKAELLGGMKESTTTSDCIQIDDILPEVFNTLLHFVYTDLLPEMEEKEEAMMAQHLLEAADRYDMQRLKLICEDTLCRHLDTSSVAITLVLAEQHNCQGLKEACIAFLKSPDSLEAVMETDGFEHLTKSCPALVKELLSKLATCSCKRRKLST